VAEKILLIRDVLDNAMLDRKGDPMGRADGIVIIDEDGRQPRVAYIEAGATVLAARLGKRIGRCVRLMAQRWGLRRGQPTRIRWKQVKEVGIELKIDVDGDQTPARAWENWLREKVIPKLPKSK
jgi:hypothetical protein